jgi:hypothetical protein
MGHKLLVFLMLFSLKLYSQIDHIQMVNLSRPAIEFYYMDTLMHAKKYKRVYFSKNASFYKANNERVFINPFAGLKEDSTINQIILEFIRSKYDYNKSKDRQTFSSPVEEISIVVHIGVTGQIIDWGLMHRSNVLDFEKEILEILPAMKSQTDLPIYIIDKKAYTYLKTFQFTNYDLYKQ